MRVLKQGMTGKAVRDWQTFLISQGLLAEGKATGTFAELTHAATVEFQRKHGLAADGIAGPITLGTAITMGLPARLEPLQQDASGQAVKKWQAYLIGQGLLEAGNVTGTFGPLTHAATVEFQRKHGLAADGVVGQVTYGTAVVHNFPLQISDPQLNFPVRQKQSLSPLSMRHAPRFELFGHFKFTQQPGSRHITIQGSWPRENIATVTLPGLKGKRGAPGSGRVEFHRKATPQLEALWETWAAKGLTDRVLMWGGSYVPRFTSATSGVLSNHAFGIAFDINVEQNRLGMRPALLGEPGCVRELVEDAHAHGFYWGGHFPNLDGMHFEIARLM